MDLRWTVAFANVPAGCEACAAALSSLWSIPSRPASSSRTAAVEVAAAAARGCLPVCLPAPRAPLASGRGLAGGCDAYVRSTAPDRSTGCCGGGVVPRKKSYPSAPPHRPSVNPRKLGSPSHPSHPTATLRNISALRNTPPALRAPLGRRASLGASLGLVGALRGRLAGRSVCKTHATERASPRHPLATQATHNTRTLLMHMRYADSWQSGPNGQESSERSEINPRPPGEVQGVKVRPA